MTCERDATMGDAMDDATDEMETAEEEEVRGRSGGESSSGDRGRMTSGCFWLRWPKVAACDELGWRQLRAGVFCALMRARKG